MNYSDAVSIVWWAPPRTATRAIGCVMQHLNMVPRPPSHVLKIPDGKENYALFCNVRNPFRRLVSVWKWQTTIGQTTDSFPVFAGKIIGKAPDWLFFETYLEGKTFTAIRTENLVEDLAKVPTLTSLLANNPKAKRDYDINILKNRFDSGGTAWNLLYDQVTADFVGKAFEKQCELFGYPKTLV